MRYLLLRCRLLLFAKVSFWPKTMDYSKAFRSISLCIHNSSLEGAILLPFKYAFQDSDMQFLQMFRRPESSFGYFCKDYRLEPSVSFLLRTNSLRRLSLTCLYPKGSYEEVEQVWQSSPSPQLLQERSMYM